MRRNSSKKGRKETVENFGTIIQAFNFKSLNEENGFVFFFPSLIRILTEGPIITFCFPYYNSVFINL